MNINDVVEKYIQEGKEKFAGWIIMWNNKKMEVDKSEAKDLWGAKKIAIKKWNVPKSKQHMMIVKPGYED